MSESLPTYDRLLQHDFGETVAAHVASAAEDQNQHSFGELCEEHGVTGPQKVLPPGASRPIEIVRVLPVGGEGNPKTARILHAPIGTPADESMTMRAMRASWALTAVGSPEQIIVVGSPAKIGRGAGSIALRDLRSVARGNFAPVNDPLFSYLRAQGITSVEHIGASWGADRALAAAQQRPEDTGVEVTNGVFIEPISVANHDVPALAQRFMQSGEQLQAYVDAANSPPLREARALSQGNIVPWLAGLLRPTNQAIISGLAALPPHVFGKSLIIALASNPEMRAHVFWGEQSEFELSEPARQQTEKAKALYEQRVTATEVKGMHHAGPDNIDLHAAMLVQSVLHNRADDLNDTDHIEQNHKGIFYW